MKNYHEAEIIESNDGFQLKVYSNSHPKGFIISKPKYIPIDKIEFLGMKKRFIFGKCMTRFNLFIKKEYIKKDLEMFKEKFPEYIYYCDKHKNWFLGVPENKISNIYDSKAGLNQLMKVPYGQLDNYLKSVHDFIKFIMQSKVELDQIGLSNSTLLGNYTLGKSDIDIIIFGKQNGWRVINFLEKNNNENLRWKSKDDWAKYYKKRIVSEFISEEEYVSSMVRKKDDGFFLDNVFSIFVVELKGEEWYDWEADYEPLGVVKIKGTVKDDYNSIVRPGYYELENTKIIEGHKEVPIKRIVNWSRPFVLQARKGEQIEACGLLEKVKAKEEEYYRIVIGYFDSYLNGRSEKEYLKVIKN